MKVAVFRMNVKLQHFPQLSSSYVQKNDAFTVFQGRTGRFEMEIGQAEPGRVIG